MPPTDAQEAIQKAVDSYRLYLCTQEIKYHKYRSRVSMFIEAAGPWDKQSAVEKFCKALKAMNVSRCGSDETSVSVVRVSHLDGCAFSTEGRRESLPIPDSAGY